MTPAILFGHYEILARRVLLENTLYHRFAAAETTGKQ